MIHTPITIVGYKNIASLTPFDVEDKIPISKEPVGVVGDTTDLHGGLAETHRNIPKDSIEVTE